jgi:hypothetical protein
MLYLWTSGGALKICPKERQHGTGILFGELDTLANKTKMLTYPAIFGDHTKTVEIRQVQGGWQVFIDNYYQGSIHRIGGELIMAPSRASQLKGMI